MQLVRPWLISATSWCLRNPKLFILLPILAVYLLAYHVVHDVLIRPWANWMAVADFRPTLSPIPDPPQYITRFSVHNPNGGVLDPKFLSSVHNLTHPGVLSGLSANGTVLLAINLYSPYLLAVFFGQWHRGNNLIVNARQLFVYVFLESLLAEVPLNSGLISGVSPSLPLGPAFARFYNYLLGAIRPFKILGSFVSALQSVLCIAYILWVYLCVGNQHKIRSGFGLVVAWLTEISLAAAAAINLLTKLHGYAHWRFLFGPVHPYTLGLYVILVLVCSLSTLFRTIYDLAGDDNMFGAEGNLHKRLIGFYLGVNGLKDEPRPKTPYSRLVPLVRSRLALSKWAGLLLPAPNPSVMLLLNMVALVAGFSTVFVFLLLIFHLLPASAYLITNYYHVLQVVLLALVLDHVLQLTFLVGTIVIDLNRVELTDLLNKALPEESPAAAASKTRRPAWRRWMAKASAEDLFFVVLWLLAIYCFWTVFCHVAILVNVIPFGLISGPNPLLQLSHRSLQSYDVLFYVEAATTIIFIVVVSELTFTFTYLKRQRKELEPSANVTPSSSLLSLSDLHGEATPYFECITLSGQHHIDVVKLFHNLKCLFLVLADLDRRVFVWLPLGGACGKPTEITPRSSNTAISETWPVNHVEISDEGNHIVLISHRLLALRCFERLTLLVKWEIQLGQLLGLDRKLRPVTSFFRKRTIAGFLARKLLMKKKPGLLLHSRRSSTLSTLLNPNFAGNFPPPPVGTGKALPDREGDTEEKIREYEQSLNRDEFVMVEENGKLVTVSCLEVKTKVYDMFSQVYGEDEDHSDLSIVSLKHLATLRVNDRIVCDISNGDILIALAVNNVWKFHLLELQNFTYNRPTFTTALPLLATPSMSENNDFQLQYMERVGSQNASVGGVNSGASGVYPARRFPPINCSTLVTIDFVGMVVRVKDLQAELIDIQTGTIIKTFYVGHFKPGTFRVVHSEPTHCKFCGCASVETMSLVYEDFSDQTLIVHTFCLENKKSRNNICLRVERDPREIRCLGFDAVVEKQYWYENVTRWEVTDINVVVGVRRKCQESESDREDGYSSQIDWRASETGFTRLKSRKHNQAAAARDTSLKAEDVWQGFVVTLLNGRLLEYGIPGNKEADTACLRPNVIAKYGYKSVALAFGPKIRILYLGGDKLIELDLYYSGSASSLKQILHPADGRNDLMFINKRRRLLERKLAKSDQ